MTLFRRCIFLSPVRVALMSALALAALAPLAAQERDSTVARVQRLVNAGDRPGARRLADSLLALAKEGTPAYAEALYARAFASSSAVEAERDYLRVSVEYTLSPRAEDATMMVAQLKLARSDRTGARRNFERLVREHPMGTQTAKAAFWAGRLAIEDGDAARGCPLLGKARASVSADDVELANQVEYYAQGCSASALAGAPPPPAAVPVTPPVASKSAPTRPAPKTPPPAPTPPPATPPPATPPPDEPPPVTPPVDSTREVVVPEPVPEVAPPPVPGKEYTVQVAAFARQRDAIALVQVLSQRGFQARVWGGAAPFRVRVGRYATREEAEADQARMKASRINGVVVEAEKP